MSKRGWSDAWTRRLLYLLLALALGGGCATGAPSGAPVNVGLVAPLSGPSGASGEAIQRGMLLAADEVNAAGGVLDGSLVVVARDVPNDPPAGEAEDYLMAVWRGGRLVPAPRPRIGE